MGSRYPRQPPQNRVAIPLRRRRRRRQGGRPLPICHVLPPGSDVLRRQIERRANQRNRACASPTTYEFRAVQYPQFQAEIDEDYLQKSVAAILQNPRGTTRSACPSDSSTTKQGKAGQQNRRQRR
ncbi:hypothetical protein FF2_001910 [Malus domestica]